MRSRADDERAACRVAADDPRYDDTEAVAAFLIGHVRSTDPNYCTCGQRLRLGAMYEHHRADELLALLRRRGWRP